MKLTVQPVCRTDYKFLYELLEKRNPCVNISHKVMPTYEEHCKFNETLPYKEDYVIYLDKEPIGRIYITKLDEIGIYFLPKYDGEMYKAVLKDFMSKIKFINVSPKNKELINILKQFNFNLIQYTYEKNIP